MLRLLFILFTLLTVTKIFGQQEFILTGKVEFEKRVNLHNNLPDDSWSTMLKKTLPKVKLSYFDLYFNEYESVYKPGKEIPDPVKVPEYLLGPAIDNVVHSNFKTNTVVARKVIYGSEYLIIDSLKKAQWKITTDTRTIAGFKCRKATTIVMDSVFVVAFYTDKIITRGGPESFNGLPGMILGLVIPRLSTSWYATKLESALTNGDILQAPQKGKKTDNRLLLEMLKPIMKDWGANGQRNLWQIVL